VINWQYEVIRTPPLLAKYHDQRQRWAVKTGMDADAHLVNLAHVVPTTIFYLRSLPAPAVLPVRSRLRPVETTVWSLSAVLLRYKMETDSDYHLVLSDSGGRTMIAEIPAPQCIATSPFLPAIRVVRRAFTARFAPTRAWQRPRVPVTIIGVGFFDFKHGQSGVAPNAIELHPVLAIRWPGGGTPSLPGGPALPVATSAPAPAASPTVAPSHAALTVVVAISPNPVSYGAYPTLSVQTAPRATCQISVVYSTGRQPISYPAHTTQADASGRIVEQGQWHMESKGTGGVATATCSAGGRTATGQAAFSIV
jgi:hypothetical protein